MDQSIKKWHSVEVTALPDSADVIASGLLQAGATGTEIDSLRKKVGEPVTVRAFFDDEVEVRVVREFVDTELSLYELDHANVILIEKGVVEQTDWLAEWKKHWRPTTIGRFIVAPPWSEVDENGKFVIKIEPNMAFGTGTHETTQLCISAISELYQTPMTMLDVGTGTAILAIAAAMLGCNDIFACDTDIDSVKIARENAVLNGVADRIEFSDGPIDADTPQFDLVAANLTLDVIVPILPLLLAKTKNILLLSGILVTQEAEIRYALKDFGANEPQIEHSGEWLSAIVMIS